jgi:hemerythrin-like metal-binding protein
MDEHKTIVWDARFETGVGEIDDQHRVLVDTLNDAGVALSRQPPKEQVDQLLQDLLAYALYHFEAEERLMQAYDYASFDAAMARLHAQQHRHFAERVVTMRQLLQATGKLDNQQLLAFLSGWLQQHILDTDQKLGAYLRTRGVAA